MDDHLAGSPDNQRSGTGRQIGPYQVLRELGRGSFGAVFLAQRPGLQRPCALKVIDRPAPDEDMVRFQQEARLASRLEHPGIASCFDVGRDPARGWPYMAIDFIPGETLQERLDRDGVLPTREAALLVAEAAAAIDYAHGAGVLHRDLKPANVLLHQKTGQPVITDFGLARDLSGSALNLTRPGEILGTPYYMAPEQVRAEQVDARTDVYALGVILYQCLCGHRPYEGRTVHEVTGKILAGGAPRPSRRRHGVPPALEAVCLRAMAHDPDARYPSAESFGRAVLEALRAPAPAASARRALLVAGLMVAAASSTAALLVVVARLGEGGEPPALAGGSPAPSPLPSPTGEVPLAEETAPVSPPLPSPAPQDLSSLDQAELRRLLSRDPRNLDAAAALAARRLDDGDHRAAAEVLAAAEAADPGGAVQLAPLVEQVEQARAEERDLVARLRERRARFECDQAREDARAAIARRPRAVGPRAFLAEQLAWNGRWEEAAAAWAEVLRLDDAPPLAPASQRQAFPELLRANERGLAEQPAGRAPAAPWGVVMGGVWEQLAGDEIRGRLFGLGPFELACLRDASSDGLGSRYRLDVELKLEGPGHAAYAGIFFGARDLNDYYVLYLIDDDRNLGGAEDHPEVRRFVEEHGRQPRLLRMGHVVDGRWEMQGQVLVLSPPQEWNALGIEVAGRSVTPVINGAPVGQIALPRDLSGSVGLAKYYATQAVWRGWRISR